MRLEKNDITCPGSYSAESGFKSKSLAFQSTWELINKYLLSTHSVPDTEQGAGSAKVN